MATEKKPEGRHARTEERFWELVAWYMLQGLDEATARRRAHDEIETTRARIEWEYRPQRAKYHSGGFDRQDSSAGIFEISPLYATIMPC